VQVRVIEAHHLPLSHRYGSEAQPFVTIHFQAGPSEPSELVRYHLAIFHTPTNAVMNTNVHTNT